MVFKNRGGVKPGKVWTKRHTTAIRSSTKEKEKRISQVWWGENLSKYLTGKVVCKRKPGGEKVEKAKTSRTQGGSFFTKLGRRVRMDGGPRGPACNQKTKGMAAPQKEGGEFRPLWTTNNGNSGVTGVQALSHPFHVQNSQHKR